MSAQPLGALCWYPGSPRLIRNQLRLEDRLTLTERHPSDFPLLKAEFAGDRQVAVHHADGYARLKGCLPPPERRGLVFIDPAFELAIPGILCAELGLYPYDRPMGLHGCGMILINPHWKLDERLSRLLPELLAVLQTGEFGQTRLEWLVPAD